MGAERRGTWRKREGTKSSTTSKSRRSAPSGDAIEPRFPSASELPAASEAPGVSTSSLTRSSHELSRGVGSWSNVPGVVRGALASLGDECSELSSSFRLARSQLSSLQEDASSSSESLWCELHTLKRHLNELEQSQSLKPSSDELQSLEQRIVAQTQQLNSSNINEQELGQHLRHLLSAAQSAAVSKGDESTENVIAALFEALRSNPFSSSYATREPFTTPYSQRQPTKATDVTHLQHELSSANHEIRKLRDEMNTMKAENASIHHIHEGRRQAHSLSDNQIATTSHVARLEERLNRLEMLLESKTSEARDEQQRQHENLAHTMESSMSSIQNTFSREVQAVRSELRNESSSLKQSVSANQNALSSLKSQVAEERERFASEASTAQRHASGLQERVEALESMSKNTNRTAHELSNRISELEPKEQALQARLSSLENDGERGARLLRIEENVSSASKQSKENADSAASLMEMTQNLRKQLSEVWEYQRGQSERISAVEDGKAASASLENSKKELWNAIEASRSTLAAYEPLQQDVDALKRGNREVSETVETMQERLKSTERRVADAESGITSVSTDVSQHTEDARKQRQELESNIAQVQRASEDLKPRIAEVERDVQNSLRKSENAITSTETERIIRDNIGEVSESLEKKTRDSFNNIREEMGDMRARLERLADRERVDHFDARLGRAEERLDTSEKNMRERIGTAEETLQDMQKRIVEDSSCTEALEQRLRAIQEQHEQAQSARSKELATVNEALRLQWDESMKGLEAAADGVGAACDRANQAIDGVYQLRGDLQGVWEETTAEARALATVQDAQDRMADVMAQLQTDTTRQLEATSRKVEDARGEARNLYLKERSERENEVNPLKNGKNGYTQRRRSDVELRALKPPQTSVSDEMSESDRSSRGGPRSSSRRRSRRQGHSLMHAITDSEG